MEKTERTRTRGAGFFMVLIAVLLMQAMFGSAVAPVAAQSGDESSATPEAIPAEEGTDGTTESTDGTEEEEADGDFGVFAVDPDSGELAPGDFVSFNVPAGVTFNDLAEVSASFTLPEGVEPSEACQLGSPRFSIGLDTDEVPDGAVDGYVFVYAATAPNFNTCSDPQDTGNTVTNGAGVYDGTQVGVSTFGATYDDIAAVVGDATVVEAFFVTEYAPIVPTSLVVSFVIPSAQFGSVVLTATFDPAFVPETGDEACFVVEDASETAVSDEICLTAEDGDGSTYTIQFDGIPAGDYSVVQTATPSGYVNDAPAEVTVVAGQNVSATIANTEQPISAIVQALIAILIQILGSIGT